MSHTVPGRIGVPLALLYDWGFFVEEHRRGEFIAWLVDNDRRIDELSPKNYDYIGTYRALSAGACDFHQIWRYGAERPPDLRAAASDSGRFTDIAREYLSFVDTSREPDEEFRLYRAAVDRTDSSE